MIYKEKHLIANRKYKLYRFILHDDSILYVIKSNDGWWSVDSKKYNIFIYEDSLYKLFKRFKNIIK